MVRCHVDEKKGILELGELEYHKKWYFPNYFRNSVLDPIISKINANGPFCPLIFSKSHNGFMATAFIASRIGLMAHIFPTS